MSRPAPAITPVAQAEEGATAAALAEEHELGLWPASLCPARQLDQPVPFHWRVPGDGLFSLARLLIDPAQRPARELLKGRNHDLYPELEPPADAVAR